MAESFQPIVVEQVINNTDTVAANTNISYVAAKLQVVDGALVADFVQTNPGVLQ